MKNKVIQIIFNAIPILIMIGLIPIIKNDYILSPVYLVVIIISLVVKRTKGDIFIFFFGFLVMIICEYIFISTGVETFVRNSLFGLMPIWLPLLWGYSFIAMKRGLKILDIQ